MTPIKENNYGFVFILTPEQYEKYEKTNPPPKKQVFSKEFKKSDKEPEKEDKPISIFDIKKVYGKKPNI